MEDASVDDRLGAFSSAVAEVRSRFLRCESQSLDEAERTVGHVLLF
jgi:hypothetical protein